MNTNFIERFHFNFPLQFLYSVFVLPVNLFFLKFHFLTTGKEGLARKLNHSVNFSYFAFAFYFRLG